MLSDSAAGCVSCFNSNCLLCCVHSACTAASISHLTLCNSDTLEIIDFEFSALEKKNSIGCLYDPSNDYDRHFHETWCCLMLMKNIPLHLSFVNSINTFSCLCKQNNSKAAQKVPVNFTRGTRTQDFIWHFLMSQSTFLVACDVLSTEQLELSLNHLPRDAILLFWVRKWLKQMIQQQFAIVMLPASGFLLAIPSLIILKFQQHTNSKWVDFQRRDYRQWGVALKMQRRLSLFSHTVLRLIWC